MYAYEPEISIVIPAYNASNYLAEAIDSALAQTYKNFEIIIINDGSKDDGATRKTAESYGNKIRYFEKENGGSSSALNVGIKNMTGEWFSWLSHDDLYYPDKLEKQVEYINMLLEDGADIEKCVFFSGSDIIDGKGKLIRKSSEEDMSRTNAVLKSIPGNEYLVAEPTKFCFHGCSCLVHKSVFEKNGAFDENLKLLNDMDLWYRIYTAGYKICYTPKALVMGRIHSKQISKSIGFSYHNPEQDMFWNRSFRWLEKYHPDNYELFYRFGRNAFIKTRFSEGKKAFEKAASIKPEKKTVLSIYSICYKTYAFMRNFAKKIYLILKA